MKVGDLVREKHERYDQTGTLPKADIGIIVLQSASGSKFLVQWLNGKRLWRYTDILEVISESGRYGNSCSDVEI